MLDPADLVTIAGRTLGVSTGDALAEMDIAAAQGESDVLYVVSVPSFGRGHLVRIRL